MPELTYRDALRSTLHEALSGDDRYFMMGEDIGAYGGSYSVTKGFLEEFGPVESHDTLKRVPPGYPPDHPMADMFRFKDIVFGRRLSDEEVYSPALPDILADAYRKATPVFRFLSTLDG